MISAEELRKMQDSKLAANQRDEKQFNSLMEYIEQILIDASNKHCKCITIRRDILKDYNRDVIYEVAKDLKEIYKYEITTEFSRDINGTVQNLTIKW